MVTNIFASSVVLYCSDALFVASLLFGVSVLLGWLVKAAGWVFVVPDVGALRSFLRFQILWLAVGLVGFKFVLLSQSVVVNKGILTGAHGSVQFSSAAECVGGVVICVGLFCWLRFLLGRLRCVS